MDVWRALSGLFLALTTTVMFVAAASAQSEPTRLPTHGDWQTFKTGDSGGGQCIAFSLPQEIKPEGLRRGDILVLVSHQPAHNDFNVIQVKMGYPLAEEKNIRMDIDGKVWELFPDSENAWPFNMDQNGEILTAMKAGIEMYVEGTSERGNTTMDRYSLRGISAALREIDGACDR